MATAIAMSECTIVRVDKEAAIRVLHDEPDLVDQLFNSSEKRLARVLLLLANYGTDPSNLPHRPPNERQRELQRWGKVPDRKVLNLLY